MPSRMQRIIVGASVEIIVAGTSAVIMNHNDEQQVQHCNEG